ncbi:alpha/beta hydrolase family esterase [Streptomyces aurantiacus]|uniref:alpha/beta hydrolase family esterase n=1 Tax=Streptomyces aurantiacus TaxID=47760 RepID=UPI0006E20FF2|nr:PHB depolymerase family esterase [Streptomyces aurantiacus]
MMRDSVEVAGRSRTYTVVGQGDGRPSRDLVLIFHGSKQTGQKHREFTGRAFDALADSGAAVVVYLDGYKKNWNDARRESRFPARKENVDDVGFVRAVIRKLTLKHGIDAGRVFAVGYSNGGQMVMRLMHDAPSLLAGAAVVAATMPAPENFLLPHTPPAPVPMPVLLIHGTKDPIVNYEGGYMRWWMRALFKVGGRSLSAPRTAHYYAVRNGITAEPVSTPLPARPGSAGGTSVERTEYRQHGRPPVVLCTVHGGGHTIPGPAKAPAVLGRTNQDVVTADLVAELFEIQNRHTPSV